MHGLITDDGVRKTRQLGNSLAEYDLNIYYNRKMNCFLDFLKVGPTSTLY